MMELIYHITTRQKWEQALEKGFYTAPSLETEGFIHCSKQEQVKGVLNRYYQDQKELLLLHIDSSKIQSPLRYERAPSVNEDFPHIYGPLNTDAVIATEAII